MTKETAKVTIKIRSHGEWDNTLDIQGDYETIVKPEVDRFYEHSKLCMNKVIERQRAYNEKFTKQ